MLFYLFYLMFLCLDAPETAIRNSGNCLCSYSYMYTDTATTTVLKPVSVLEFIKSRFNPQSPKHIDWDKVLINVYFVKLMES